MSSLLSTHLPTSPCAHSHSWHSGNAKQRPSPQGSYAWSKKWAGRLEEELQELYTPKSKTERRALHTRAGTNMENMTSPGVVGVTVLLPRFFELYPNVQFKFKQGEYKGTYYGHQDGKSCYLSTEKPEPK